MSRILGIFQQDGRPADRAILDRLLRVCDDAGADVTSIWIDGSTAIAHRHFHVTPESVHEVQPLVADRVVICFDGRLDNRRELLDGFPRGAACAGSSDAALVAAAYQAHGDRCFGRLVGDFALALFDARAQTLFLARDIMAPRSLYYTAVRGGVAFASDIKALLGHPEVSARPDEDGVADLVLNGYCDGDRTWFEGIRSVPPGAVVAITRERVSVTQAWEFDEREIRYRSFAEYADHFSALFTQAVERRLRSVGPVGVAVSGGVDSSAIYCEAARLRGSAALRGVTLAFPRGTPADEHAFVDALRGRGLPVDDVAVSQVTWQVSTDTDLVGNDVPAIFWGEQDALLARAREAGCRVILNGFFADQLLTGDAYLLDLAHRGRLGLVRRHLRETASWMADVEPSVLRRRFARAAIRATAPAWAMRAVRRARATTPALDRYPRWFTASFRERAFQRTLDRCRRPSRFASAHAEECRRLATSGHYLPGLLQTGSLGLRHQLDTAYPFRDRDLVAFVMSIPGDIVNHGGVPKALLRRAGEGLVPELIRLRRTKGDATAFSNRAARAAEEAVRALLGPDSLSARAGFVDAEALRAQMPAMFGAGLARDDSAQLSWQVGDTLGLELWLRRFFSGPSWN